MIKAEMPIQSNPGAKALIETLRDKKVDSIVMGAASDIDTVATFLGIDLNYLSIQARLLLPFYTESEVEAEPSISLIRQVLTKLRESLYKYKDNYQSHRQNNGIDTLSSDAKLVSREGQLGILESGGAHSIRFLSIDTSIGLEIQEKLHYIHKARGDTVFHFGLLLEKTAYPLCYCALSYCDRHYQAKALSNIVGTEISPDEILVLTRSFGFSPLPHNMMSKLLDQAAANIAQETKSKYIITALNPFLGFKGTIFLGSSYIPFATSPMVYNYSPKGLYLNRRNSEETVIRQRYKTPPIVWFARAVPGGRIGKKRQRELEEIKNYYEISLEEYTQR
jgi:hypothetical protein